MSSGHHLPNSWVVASVGDLADSVQPGFPYGQYNTIGNGYPQLRPMNIDSNGRLALDEVKYAAVESPPMLLENDVLFNNTNSPELVGKTTAIRQDARFTFSNHMTRIRFNRHIGHPGFFALQLHSLQRDGYFRARCNNHVNQASISSSYLASSVYLAVPPVAEQRRIVAAIEEQLTRLDAGVDALKRAQARLKRYRAAVLKAAVEGKLTEEWRAANPPTDTAPQLLKRILAERKVRWEADLRAKGKDPSKVRYEEPTGPDVNGLPELPEGWCWVTVEQVSQNVRYGSSARAATEIDGVPILRMGNIKEGSLDFSSLKFLPLEHEEFPSLLLEPGDLLFNRTNSAELVGKSAVYHGVPSPLTFASYLICVRLVKDCSPDYLCYFINSEYGRHWVASVVSQQVGQANVNGSKLQALAYPVPPAAEQLQIVDEVERRLSVVSELESTIDTNLKRAENLRQSILREAFAGRLVRQDPADEPASVLLERIRLERGVTLPGSSPLTTILSRKRKAEETVGSASGMSVPSAEEYAKVAEAAEAYSASRPSLEAQQLPLLLDGIATP